MKRGILTYFLFISFHGFSQEKGKILYASSPWKSVNTLSFFESKPLAFVETKHPEIVQKKVIEVEKEINKNIVYFDKQDQVTTEKTAYYYRKADFKNGIPKNLVEDFYLEGNKAKFKGAYYSYDANDERKNIKYNGVCEFYELDGSRTSRTYKNGKLIDERKFNSKNLLSGETRYTSNNTRAYFKEQLYDAKGNIAEIIQGKFNTELQIDESEHSFFVDGKKVSSMLYRGNCPTTRGTFLMPNGESSNMVLQDFTCELNQEWAFMNATDFTATSNEKSYQIKSNNSQSGFITIPITNDFKNRRFVINAIFDKPSQGSMPVIGIVWQFQDAQNYNYYSIDLLNKKFEINSLVAGVQNRYMNGIRPKINLTDNPNSYTLTIEANPVNDSFVYTVNDFTIQNYTKFPLIAKDAKSWNVGLMFKAQNSNETITLKRFEVKLF